MSQDPSADGSPGRSATIPGSFLPAVVVVRSCDRGRPQCNRQGHGFGAPQSENGKTLLASTAAWVFTGRAPVLFPPVGEGEEERKRIMTLFSEGPLVTVIDNLPDGEPYRSEALCAALTSETYSDRNLGAMKGRHVRTNVLLAVTGNGLTLAGDLTTRALVCMIDSKLEEAGKRTFKVEDLQEHILKRRARLAVAALTITRAYLVAGAPKVDCIREGRFTQWSRWCREPLIWLGMADPLLTQGRVKEADPTREEVVQLLSLWRREFGDTGASVKTACERAERPRTGDPRTATYGDAELRAELLDLCGPGTEDAGINRRKLGWMLRNATGRVARITDPGETIPGALFAVRLESWKPNLDDKPHYRAVKVGPSAKVGS